MKFNLTNKKYLSMFKLLRFIYNSLFKIFNILFYKSIKKAYKSIKKAYKSIKKAYETIILKKYKAKLEKYEAKLASAFKSVSVYKDKIEYLRVILAVHNLTRPATIQIQFARILKEQNFGFKSDCYISLLPSSLHAALALKDKYGGKVICDLVENVDVHKHSLAPKWDFEVTKFINRFSKGAIIEADGLMTVSNALSEDFKRFKLPILTVKNFRNFEEPIAANTLRERLDIPNDHTILFASGNIVIGFEVVLEALHKLPETFHLVALVAIKPQTYSEKISELINDLDIAHRVHLLPFVEYENLASIAAEADIGLYISDIANPNGAVALPNRIFDYLTGGLPVISPAMPDVKYLMDHYDFGQIVSPLTAENWRSAMVAVKKRIKYFKKQAQQARKILTWESQEDNIYDFLGRPKSVTMLSFRDLSRYQRYKRLTVSLQKRGCEVKKVFFSKDPHFSGLQDGIEHYWVRDPYSIDGIIKLDIKTPRL